MDVESVSADVESVSTDVESVSTNVDPTVERKEFATDILELVLSEMEYLREEFGTEDRVTSRRNIEQKFSLEKQRVGKAATLFALKNRKDVKLAMKERGVSPDSIDSTLDDFIRTLSQKYLNGTESLPETWCPTEVLMFCGLIGAVEDCCQVAAAKEELVLVCVNNLELYLRSCWERLQEVGVWESLYAAAEAFAQEYDTQYMANAAYDGAELKDDPKDDPKEESQS